MTNTVVVCLFSDVSSIRLLIATKSVRRFSFLPSSFSLTCFWSISSQNSRKWALNVTTRTFTLLLHCIGLFAGMRHNGERFFFLQRLKSESNKSRREVRAWFRQGALYLSGILLAAGTDRHTSGTQSVILTSVIPCIIAWIWLSFMHASCTTATVEESDSDLCELVYLHKCCSDPEAVVSVPYSRPLAACDGRYWAWSRCLCRI